MGSERAGGVALPLPQAVRQGPLSPSHKTVAAAAQETDESRWLLKFCFAYGFIMLVFLNYAAVLPLVQQEWGLSNQSAGLIFSSYQLGYILSATLLTYLTDRFRARTIFLFSATWSVVANLLFALFAVDQTSAIVYRALAGLGMGGTYMPGLKLVADRFPSTQRGRAVGYFTSAFVFGAAASTLLSGIVGSLAGWRFAIVTTAAGTLVGTLLCLALLQGDRGVMAGDAGKPYVGTIRDASVDGGLPHDEPPRVGLRQGEGRRPGGELDGPHRGCRWLLHVYRRRSVRPPGSSTDGIDDHAHQCRVLPGVWMARGPSTSPPGARRHCVQLLRCCGDPDPLRGIDGTRAAPLRRSGHGFSDPHWVSRGNSLPDRVRVDPRHHEPRPK
jgi:hypothetical protein